MSIASHKNWVAYASCKISEFSNNMTLHFRRMSSSEARGCVSEVTLAISKSKGPQQSNNAQTLDSPDSSCSGNSNSFTVQRFEYTDDESQNGNTEFQEPSAANDLRIPIVGYEVMEERARFTVSICVWYTFLLGIFQLVLLVHCFKVYKLRVEFKNGDCWFVFRRYTDFVRLFTQLRRQKAAVSHLSLPRKKWLGDNFAPSFLEDRIRGLQSFVNGLLNNPDLVNLVCVREFFCLDEPPALSDTVEESRVSTSYR